MSSIIFRRFESCDLKNRVIGSLGNRVIGTKIRLTTEEKSSRENKKFNISNTAWQSHNQNLTTEAQRHGDTETRRKASELTRMTAEFTRIGWEIKVKDKARRKTENTEKI